MSETVNKHLIGIILPFKYIYPKIKEFGLKNRFVRTERVPDQFPHHPSCAPSPGGPLSPCPRGQCHPFTSGRVSHKCWSRGIISSRPHLPALGGWQPGFQASSMALTVCPCVSPSTFSYIHRCVTGAYPVSSLIFLLRNRFYNGNDVSELNQISPGFHVKRSQCVSILTVDSQEKLFNMAFWEATLKTVTQLLSTSFPRAILLSVPKSTVW